MATTGVPQKENLRWPIEHPQIRVGGLAKIHGDPGTGNSVALRPLAVRLARLPDDAAIVKHAKTHEWTRNLTAKIQAKADAKVSAAMVSAEVSGRKALTEAVRVEVEAEIQARIRIDRPKDIGRPLHLPREWFACRSRAWLRRQCQQPSPHVLPASHGAAEGCQGRERRSGILGLRQFPGLPWHPSR